MTEKENQQGTMPTWSVTVLWRRFGHEALLVLVLLLAAYLRFTGLDWDADTHLHPDERFLTMVESALQPVQGIGEYFNTETSTLNPNNVGYTFFVYGTLPIFIVRYLAEWLGQTGYGEVYLLGRVASAAFDLVSVLLVYLIAARLYRRRVALLAAAFTAGSVLLIQHAHFFVVDPFANTFILAGFYFAVRVLDEGRLWDYLLFGLALGMAVASKISAAPLAGMIVLAALPNIRAADDRRRALERALKYIGAAALVSLVAFRIFQPYAFSGPTFFGLSLNPKWVATMGEIRRQTSGAADFPPALQWADRTPLWFSFQNMVLWGMGLPLGLAAWGGWSWALYRIWRRREWDRHLLPVVWSGGFFIVQSIGFTKAMRYEMPVYPTLAILGAWALWELWDRADQILNWVQPRLARGLAGALGVVVLGWTLVYAFAFLGIYTRPITRVEASRWIYRHVPAAVNLVLENEAGVGFEPIPTQLEFVLGSARPVEYAFRASADGMARGFLTPFLADLSPEAGQTGLKVSLYEESNPGPLLATATLEGPLGAAAQSRLELPFETPVPLEEGKAYVIWMETTGLGAVALKGEAALVGQDGSQLVTIKPAQHSRGIASGAPQPIVFTNRAEGQVLGVFLPYVDLVSEETGFGGLRALLRAPGSGEVLAQGSAQPSQPANGEAAVEIDFASPAQVHAGENYELVLEVISSGAVSLRTSVLVHETTWDDNLPVRIDGRDGFGGIYASANQELYWPDDQDDDGGGVPDKQERIVETLAHGDYLVISSNRQYGSIARVPERYPLATAYYRLLFNCPSPEPVWSCADRAQPGQVTDELGYELVAAFDSNPELFGLEISDQGAEESFTVYDHPKVLIFAKKEAFDQERLNQSLSQVDVSQVRNVAPRDLGATRRPSLVLPEYRWQAMRQHGTWSRIFPPGLPWNQVPLVAVIVWWLTIAAIGWTAYPLLRTALPGLNDGGYALSRIAGLLIVGWATWFLASLQVPFTRLTIGIVLLAMASVSAALVWRDREDWQAYLREKKREIAWVEVIALSFFLIDLAIRIGNPDLWHPSKGGEKPMDLSYLNAVLKSISFPPYDPWFAGGYINYYYFGFVLIGWPMKLLGLQTSLAYNLAVPTLFALLALGGYAAGVNLLWPDREQAEAGTQVSRFAGVSAAVILVLMGNLGTVRMLWDALLQVGAAGAEAAGGLLLDGVYAARGLGRVLLEQERLPIALDHWYWNPSRAIPPGSGELSGPITEFPFFTFLYADLHAHMLSLPLTAAVLVWGIAWIRSVREGRSLTEPGAMVSLFFGGLLIGALRPTNTWDFPTYLALGGIATLSAPWLRRQSFDWRSVIESLAAALALLALALALFYPYALWYGQGYTQAKLWEGSKTQLVDYLTHFGLFAFAILSWLVWETHQWMAQTPLSSLNRLRPYWTYIALAFAALVASTLLLAGLGYHIAWLVLPMMAWCAILLIRPGQPVQKRVVLFIVATGLALSLAVEVVVLSGDIGRMNTVFKFYLQVWTLLSVAAAACLAWVLARLVEWPNRLRNAWALGLALVVFAAALYPLTATPAKVRDRMSAEAPHTLRGMAFMQHATYHDQGTAIPLAEDYEAIQWMRREVEGSPVIVEANVPEYRWGSRFTIYTGLPGVLGWNWHQRQQRVVSGDQEVWKRAHDITAFYTTQSAEAARQFLRDYEVKYVVVGQLEQIYYAFVEPCWPVGEAGGGVTCDLGGRAVGMESPEVSPQACEPANPGSDEVRLRCPTYGLDKFDSLVSRGVLKLAFETGDTRIYEVIQ